MKYITLSNGLLMPMLGYGVYQVTKDECQRCVEDALEVGYRLIDTAQSYFNEEAVGSAIEHSEVKREEIFLTTKVWIEHYGFEETKASVYKSLEKLKTDYLDLCLLHQPFSDYYGAYRALEDLYSEGVLKAIGVSNFYPDRLVDLASFTKIPPQVNQIERHPYQQQKEAFVWMDKYHVQKEAWAPFGEGRKDIFKDETLNRIAISHQKTVAQVILRWQLQTGCVAIPKSIHKERMVENFNIFDFELTKEELLQIASLDTNESSFFSHYDPNKVEWFVKMVEQRKSTHDCTKEKKSW